MMPEARGSLQDKQRALAASLGEAERRREQSQLRRKVRRRREQYSALRIGVGMLKKAGKAREALLKKKAEAHDGGANAAPGAAPQ